MALESFWDSLSDEADAVARCWLIIPPTEVKERVRDVQASFSELDWVAAVPEDFLHVSAPASAGEWSGLPPFTLTYRCVNCFHDAAIVEAHAGPGAPFPPAPFLPHLSIGYFRRAERPDRLRDALVPRRDVELGSGVVDEVLVCDVPIGKSRFFEPWLVVDRVRLGG
jgi:hypothetical protein